MSRLVGARFSFWGPVQTGWSLVRSLPLFKRMGFKDVQHYHPGEQGKDIVTWMPTPLDDREYYAVDHPLCERNS